jgi:hypothetical protein
VKRAVILGAVLALLLQGVAWPELRERGEAGLFPGGATLVLKEERKPLFPSPLLPPKGEKPSPLSLRPWKAPPFLQKTPLPGPLLYLLYGKLQLEGG